MSKRRMPKDAPLVAITTCGSRAEAQRITRAVVEKQLAACVNIFTAPVQSIFRWKGKVKKAKEWVLLMKTNAAAVSRLEAEIKRLHSYDVPEFVAMQIAAGSRDYLSWLSANISRA